MLSFLIFISALVLMVKSASVSMKYSERVASDLQISKHLVGFLIIAGISVLPEGLISVMSALEGEPSLGLGTLFGSNVADLTLIFAIIVFFARRNLKIKSKIINNSYLYILTMLCPLILGLDGAYSRGEGVLLVGIGVLFYYWLLKKDKEMYSDVKCCFNIKNFIYLILSMGLLLVGAYLIVESGLEMANILEINPILIGLFAVSLGTTLPELFFSIEAVRKREDEIALGDILGTVITDAVILVGIVAVVNPFEFPLRIIYVTGVFMLVATVILFYLMKNDKALSMREGLILIGLYLIFLITESTVNF